MKTCPPNQVWDEVAAGLTPDDEAAWLLDHASQCAACALELKAAVEILGDGSAASQTVDRKVVAFPARWLSWKSVSAIAASVLVLVTVAWWASYSSTGGAETSRLLAQAYTESRPFEFRLPDAGYSPVRVERGLVQGAEASPELMLVLARLHKSASADPKLRAWATLLSSADPTTAVSMLEDRAASPAVTEDAEWLNLLGVAHSRQGDFTQNPDRYRAALNDFERAAKARPDWSIPKFNRALTLLRLARNEEAFAAWNEVLNLLAETDPWRAEAVRYRERSRIPDAAR